MKHKIAKIYIVGTDHLTQWGDKSPKAAILASCLIKELNSSKIDFIGEEFSIESFLPSDNLTISQKVAKQFNIKHSFCDPNDKIRGKFGYPTQVQLRDKFGFRSAFLDTEEYKARKEYEKDFWYIREKYWLDKINSISAKNIIFVCGYNHIDGFSKLLIKNGYCVRAVRV